MERVRELLAHRGIALLAAVFALAFATYQTALALAQLVVFVLNQHAGNEDFDPLDFEVLGTRLSLDGLVQSALALVVVVAILLALWRLSRRALRTCPECQSSVPRTATVCRYCTSELGGAI